MAQAESGYVFSGEVTLARKLGVLNFIGAAGLPPDKVLLLYVAAASNPQDAVARRGEELQKKQCPYDTTKPAVDLEDAGDASHHEIWKNYQSQAKQCPYDTTELAVDLEDAGDTSLSVFMLT